MRGSQPVSLDMVLLGALCVADLGLGVTIDISTACSRYIALGERSRMAFSVYSLLFDGWILFGVCPDRGRSQGYSASGRVGPRYGEEKGGAGKKAASLQKVRAQGPTVWSMWVYCDTQSVSFPFS